MTKALAVPKPLEFWMTYEELMEQSVRISSAIQGQFKKEVKTIRVNICHPKVSALHPVFSKSLIISRYPADVDDTDLPDMIDVLDTTLPWVGFATLQAASRQFRNKFHLSISVELVLELGGKLYRILDTTHRKVSITDERPTPSIYVRQNQLSTIKEPGICIHRLVEMGRQEALALCTPDGGVGDELVTYLKKMGFDYSGHIEFAHQFTAGGIELTAYECGVISDF